MLNCLKGREVLEQNVQLAALSVCIQTYSDPLPYVFYALLTLLVYPPLRGICPDRHQ